MTFEDYRNHDAVSLAELIKKKEITPLELLDIAIKRAEEVNPKINAIVTKLHDRAKEQLRNLDMNAPFAGVPFLIKDLDVQIKGTPFTGASRLLKDFVSLESSEVGNRILDAGLIVFAKTNTSEFGLNPYVESEMFGPCNNPWNLAYTSGGSSGGSAAAVAAGIVPLAFASDGGGSIRIPASCCGLFGLKPSRGRLSNGPSFGEVWGGAVSSGAVSRSVRDNAHYIDLVQGEVPGDPYIIQKPERPYAEEIKLEPGKLKIGYSYQMPTGFDFAIDPENIKAIETALTVIRELGHEVEEVPIPYSKEVLTQCLFMMVMGELSAALDYIGDLRGKKALYHELEPNTWLLYKLGKTFTAGDFVLAKLKWNEVQRAMGQFHLKYDFLLTPTLGMKPFKTGFLQTSKFENKALRLLNALGISSLVKYTGLIEKTSSKIFSWIPYAPLANITGQPSMTVPLHWSAENLPVGVMFTAKMNNEAGLYRLAAQLEKAKPWFNKVPAI